MITSWLARLNWRREARRLSNMDYSERDISSTQALTDRCDEVNGGEVSNHQTVPPLPPKPVKPRFSKFRRYERATHKNNQNSRRNDAENVINMTYLPPNARQNERVGPNYSEAESVKVPLSIDDAEDSPEYKGNIKDKASCCNPCSKLFLSSRKEYRVAKAFFAVLVSAVLGIAMYEVFVHGYQYSEFMAGGISIAATVIMSLCFAISVKARCTGALIVPSLCTAQGRTAILSLIAGLILMGPMMNITKNLEHVAYSIACGAEMANNLSREIRILHSEPMLLFIDRLRPTIAKLQREEARLHDNLHNVSALMDSLQSHTNHSQGCNDQMQSVYSACDREVNAAQTECDRRSQTHRCDFESVKELCKKRLKAMCEKTSFVRTHDQPLRKSAEVLQEMMAMLSTDVNISSSHTSNNPDTFNDTYHYINEYIHKKAQTARYIITLIQIIGKALSMSIILLIVHSFVYLRHFLTKDTFDNCYITSGMKRLDAENHAQHKPSVLPLRKAERRTYIDSTTLRLSRQEKAQFKHGLATLCLHMVAGGIVCVFDYFLYRVLDIIDNQITIDTNVASTIQTVHVSGSGFLSHIIKMFTSAINESLQSHELEQCTQVPNRPAYTKYYVIAAAYCLAFILVFTQSYAMRLRRKVVAYYYPERETERNHYLILRIVRKRQNFTNRLTRNIQRTFHEMKRVKKERISVWVGVKRVFCWKVKRPAHCLVCDDVDEGSLYHCFTDKCQGTYCRECFRDVRNVCQLCFVHETV